MIRISRTARQPPRVPWPLDELVHKRSIALGLALDISSQSTYSSALNSYLTFCSLHGFAIEPTPDTLSFFVVYMSHHIEPRSVGTYLSGVVSSLEPHFPNVRAVRNGMLVARTLKGCKRLRSKPIRRKQPISRDHLRTAARKLSPRSAYDDVLFVSMLFVGFYGLLRLGEMTMPDNPSLRNPRKYSRRSSVEWIPQGFAFWLPTHKTDSTFEGSRDGVSPHLIQATGRWSSDTFQIYIRKNPVILQAMLYTRRPDAAASA
ncbi:hypothetical protein IW262DRAFT_1279546 [Armillaria fumosa]|nr:hypothetical protein IW262DRAFT_1279546 [Armillaria fumosa]